MVLGVDVIRGGGGGGGTPFLTLFRSFSLFSTEKMFFFHSSVRFYRSVDLSTLKERRGKCYSEHPLTHCGLNKTVQKKITDK